jgi:DNA modification methylase
VFNILLFNNLEQAENWNLTAESHLSVVLLRWWLPCQRVSNNHSVECVFLVRKLSKLSEDKAHGTELAKWTDCPWA